MTRLVIRDRDNLRDILQAVGDLCMDQYWAEFDAAVESLVDADFTAITAHSDGQGCAWIAVADQVPPVDSFGWSFECWCAGGTEVYRGFYSPDGNFYDEGGEVFHGMTHWQPIVEPAPPVDAARSTQNSDTPEEASDEG